MLEKLLEEIEDLKRAKQLLQALWDDLGPYAKLELTLRPKLWSEIRDYFKFDDSE